jgi:hypothetical protein
MAIEKQKPISAHNDLNCSGLSLPNLSIRDSKDSSIVSGPSGVCWWLLPPNCPVTDSEMMSPSSFTSLLASVMGSPVMVVAATQSICSALCLETALIVSSGLGSGVADCCLLIASAGVPPSGSSLVSTVVYVVGPLGLGASVRAKLEDWQLSVGLSCESSIEGVWGAWGITGNRV